MYLKSYLNTNIFILMLLFYHFYLIIYNIRYTEYYLNTNHGGYIYE
nr:MAG TPA: hypothetical protein [Caudoviricetes sp.]